MSSEKIARIYRSVVVKLKQATQGKDKGGIFYRVGNSFIILLPDKIM